MINEGIPTEPIQGQVIDGGYGLMEGQIIDGGYGGSSARPTTIHTGRLISTPKGFDSLEVSPPVQVVGPESAPIGS